MEKLPGYNRNLMNGKRPHKKIQRYGRYKTISERLIAEAVGLATYQKRVGQSNKITWVKGTGKNLIKTI